MVYTVKLWEWILTLWGHEASGPMLKQKVFRDRQACGMKEEAEEESLLHHCVEKALKSITENLIFKRKSEVTSELLKDFLFIVAFALTKDYRNFR